MMCELRSDGGSLRTIIYLVDKTRSLTIIFADLRAGLTISPKYLVPATHLGCPTFVLAS
jgi:hypothetical protein